MLTGTIKVWPKGSNYKNHFTQVAFKGKSDTYIFNGYVTPLEIEEFNSVVEDWTCIKIMQMHPKIGRRQSKEQLSDWCKIKKVTEFNNWLMFVNQMRLNGEIAFNKDADASKEKEVIFTEDLIPDDLLKEIKKEQDELNKEYKQA